MTDNLKELERRLDDHPNCHSLGVAPEKLRALIAKAREADELRAEVERLREQISDCRGSAANAEAEPVAWLYSRNLKWPMQGGREYYTSRERHPVRSANGWTETPLYPASALEQVRKDALEEAAKIAESPEPLAGVRPETFADQSLHIATAIRNLKDQANG